MEVKPRVRRERLFLKAKGSGERGRELMGKRSGGERSVQSEGGSHRLGSGGTGELLLLA